VDLLGAPLFLLTIALAVAAPVGTLLLWGRVRGAGGVQVAQRLGLVVMCQLTAVLLASVALNREYVFYESWSDLFGQDDNSSAVVQGTGSPQHGGTGATGGTGPAGPTGAAVSGDRALPPIPGLRQITGDPRVVREVVRGPASRVQAEVTYLTPPGYGDPAKAGKRYPVVMFLPGYPGTPSTWINKLGLQDVMDAEIAAGRVQPFIAVLPKLNVDGTRDLECSDVANGPAAGTWLGVDVPRIVQSQVRALPPGRDWAVAGYSTGGFCSGKLTLQYPRTFGSAAVLSGYFSPDTATGADLFGGDTRREQANDPMWIVRHGTPPAVRVLVVYSAQDPGTAQPSTAFIAAARPPLRVDQIRLPQGGHNTGVWQGVLPQVLRWLGGTV
jgi:enterochelin esterase-like enzyme